MRIIPQIWVLTSDRAFFIVTAEIDYKGFYTTGFCNQLQLKRLQWDFVTESQNRHWNDYNLYETPPWSRFLHFVSEWKTLEGLKIAADFSASCSGAAAVSDGADFPVMEGFTECATHTATATLGSRIRSEWNERSRAWWWRERKFPKVISRLMIIRYYCSNCNKLPWFLKKKCSRHTCGQLVHLTWEVGA